MVKKRVLYIVLLFFLSIGHALSYEQDTTLILISNINIQIETTQALNDMYNFKFDKAEQQFRWLKQKYAWHPLPYFLLGLSEWWKIIPNFNNTSHHNRFITYMDSAILVAKHLQKKSPEYTIEVAFFLAASYSFKGRLYSESKEKQWVKAAAAGKTALYYLKKSKTKTHLNPELLFGDALYNYFTVWIPKYYPMLKPLFWFFPKGDKKLGLKQLTEVSYNAFYTRTEAMVWLMRIFNDYEEHKSNQALQIAQYLHYTYPDNPYFHRYYAKVLYNTNRFEEVERQSKQIIQRIDSNMVGYDANSGRYASYYLGELYQMQNNLDSAKKYYLLMETYAQSVEDTDSWYYLASLFALGDIYRVQGNKQVSITYFFKIMERTKRKNSFFKEAKKKITDLEKIK